MLQALRAAPAFRPNAADVTSCSPPALTAWCLALDCKAEHKGSWQLQLMDKPAHNSKRAHALGAISHHRVLQVAMNKLNPLLTGFLRIPCQSMRQKQVES